MRTNEISNCREVEARGDKTLTGKLQGGLEVGQSPEISVKKRKIYESMDEFTKSFGRLRLIAACFPSVFEDCEC
jgi:hypothetical protein